MRREDDEPELDAKDRELIRKLRELPHEGNEPDWAALERSIRDAVGPDAPKPWWRRWRWMVPVGALAATAAGALLWLRHPEPEVTPPPPAPHEQPAQSPPSDEATAVWLGGRVLDLGDVDPAQLDELDRDARDALGSDQADAGATGLLPANDLGWIDTLDDTALERAETWLAGKKG
jgi:hypothetical protein